MKPFCIALLVVAPAVANAQLEVSVSPPKSTGQKVVVPLAMRNGFSEKIESARAAVFLLDEQGKMVGNASRWVIGGTKAASGLVPGATNAFSFVIQANRPITTTNLTTKVSFSRLVLDGGRLADPNKSVVVRPSPK